MEKNIQNENRRDFLKKAGIFIGVGIGTSSLSSLLNSCQSDQSIFIPPPELYSLDLKDPKYSALQTVGVSIETKIAGKNNNNPLYIKHVDTPTFVVFDSSCSHEGCTVGLPTSPTADIICPCHQVQYNSDTGEVTKNPVSGWSPIPLKKYEVVSFDSANNILKINL